MKRHTFVLGIVTLFGLVGCGGATPSQIVSSLSSASSAQDSLPSETSSVSSAQSSLSSEASSVSSVQESLSSQTSSVTSEPPETTLDLISLRSGFSARSIFSKTYDNGKPSLTLLDTFIGNEVVKSKKYTGDSWETSKLLNCYQYEKGENDLVYSVQCDLEGKPVYTNVQLLDERTGSDADFTWEEAGLVNAFTLFDETDFVLTEDKTYELNISENPDETEAFALASLARQFYLYVDGYVNHYFIKQQLDSFSITVDEAGLPLTYSASFEDLVTDDGWGGVSILHQSIEGSFTGFGEEVISRYEQPEKLYPELDTAFDQLKKQNYAFSFRRFEKGDGMYSSGFQNILVDGTSDGNGNFEVEGTVKSGAWGNETAQHYGYKQIDSTTYRKYSVSGEDRIFSGEAVEGSVNEDILPAFAFSSALFEKDPSSTEEFSVFRFVKPELIDSNAVMDSSYAGFGLSSYSNYAFGELIVTVTYDTVRIYNTIGVRYSDILFSKIGSIGNLNVTVAEPTE